MNDFLIILSAVYASAALVLAALDTMGNHTRTARVLFKIPAFYLGMLTTAAVVLLAALMCWALM